MHDKPRPSRTGLCHSAAQPRTDAQRRRRQETLRQALCRLPRQRPEGVDKGEKKGPPLLHKIYEPSHHGDAAFQLAAKNGVRAHHWPFGDMAPVSREVTPDDVAHITAYVRMEQKSRNPIVTSTRQGDAVPLESPGYSPQHLHQRRRPMKRTCLALALATSAFTASTGGFTLSSPDIKPNAAIKDTQVFNGFGCTGGNVSPALEWKGAQGHKELCAAGS